MFVPFEIFQALSKILIDLLNFSLVRIKTVSKSLFWDCAVFVNILPWELIAF